METRFQTTSFIPKSSLDNVVSEDGQIQKSSGGHSTTGSLVTLICFFLFVCSLVSGGVVFFLDKLANTTKAQAEKDLAAYQKRNTTETITEIKNLQDRLNLVDGLVRNHTAVSPLFDQLAAVTLSRVSFSAFDLKKKNDGSFSLALKAQGVGYESIVAQDTQFSSVIAQKTFKNTIISDFSKPKGQDLASFSLTTTVASPAVNFATLIGGTGAVVNSAVPGGSATNTPNQ
ncbi:MAG: hypothetical protein V4576_02575 [Patescibacteria group bacterium]